MPVDTCELGPRLRSRFDSLRKMSTNKHAAWFGVHRSTGCDAVIKVAFVESNFAIGLRREIAALRELSGVQGVVRVLDSDEDDDGFVWLATEHSGESILEAWRREPQPPERALGLALFLVHTLTRVHARALVHNDVAWNNVVVQSIDGRDRFTLIDFDVCYQEHRDTLGPHGSSTRGHYRTPPELFTGGIDLPKIDVWYAGLMVGDVLRLWPKSPGSPTVSDDVQWHGRFVDCVRAAVNGKVAERPTMAKFAQQLEATDALRRGGVAALRVRARSAASAVRRQGGGRILLAMVVACSVAVGWWQFNASRATATGVASSRDFKSVSIPVALSAGEPATDIAVREEEVIVERALAAPPAIVDMEPRTHASASDNRLDIEPRSGPRPERSGGRAGESGSWSVASLGSNGSGGAAEQGEERSLDAPQGEHTARANVTISVLDGPMNVVVSCGDTSRQLTFAEPGSRSVRVEDGCSVLGLWEADGELQRTTPLFLTLDGVPRVVRCNPIFGRCGEYLQ